jgi:RimJ/RimL family protein N-acetyltransferase
VRDLDALDLPTLEDGDLRLRLPDDRDVDRIAAICSDTEVARWTRVPVPYTRSHAAGYVANAQEAWDARRGLVQVAVDPDDRVLAGCGLSLDARDGAGEVGYWVAPDARRRGVATRTVRLVLGWAFGVAGLGYVSMTAATENVGSNAVAERLGFTLEGTSRSAAVLLDGDGRPVRRVDVHLWGLRPGELR